MKHTLLIAYCLIATTSSLFSQSDGYSGVFSQWKIKHITADQGLSNNQVTSISEDRNGYIWIGTAFGLNRFDGISVESFFHNTTDSSSLSTNFISKLFQDSNGTLWIGTDNKLYMYSDSLEQFKFILDKRTFDICEDKNKNIIISTTSGLFSFDLNTGQMTKINLSEVGATNNDVCRTIVDRHNNLWFHLNRSGLYYYDRINNSLKKIQDDHKYLVDERIEVLHLDSNNNLWIGSLNAGLFKLKNKDSELQPIHISSTNPYTSRVRVVFEDIKGGIFVGTRGGLYHKKSEDDSFILYADDHHNQSILSQNSIISSYLDKTGNIWLGTHSGGINYIDQHQKPFIHIPYIPDNNLAINNPSVTSFAEISNELFIGTHKGINILDKTSGKFRYLEHEPGNPLTITHNDVKSISIASPDSIWVGTNGGGLNLVTQQGQVISSFHPDSDDPNSLPSDKVYLTHIGKNGELWIVSKNWALSSRPVLSRYNKRTNQFQNYHGDFTSAIHEPTDGNTMLIGGRTGFFIFDLARDTLVEIKNEDKIFNTNALFQDDHNNIWVGSGNGLIKYDLEDEVFTDVKAKTRVGEVYGILDNGPNLWISTNDGLIKFLNIYSADSTLGFRRFDHKDGLQSREFNENSFLKGKDGTFYFGGNNGFNMFHPEKITSNPYKPKIQFTSLKVADKVVLPNVAIDGHTLLKKSLKYTRSISIPYDFTSFTIVFDALHFASPEDNRYKYRLEGVEKVWNFANAYSNSVTYHNLAPNNYELVVYSINADGIESDAPARLKINVQSPYWMTMWFRTLMAIAVAIMLSVFYQLRTRWHHKKRLELQRIVNERTEELRSERDQLERTMKSLVESEKMASIGVFTAGIAHELNNPMNYISGATYRLFSILEEKNEKAQNTEDLEELKETEEMIKSGIKRISGIVESLKNYTRSDNNVFTRYNIISSIEDALTITETKIKDRISIIRDYPAKVIIECLPSRISQVMINLIDNAADAIEGEGTITIGVREEPDKVVILIEDSGSGIEQENLKFLFDPFFTTKEVGKGTGLGLYVSHGYVMRHGGSISASCKVNGGSQFKVELPMKQKEPNVKRDLEIED